jgi:hypothetical protein
VRGSEVKRKSWTRVACASSLPLLRIFRLTVERDVVLAEAYLGVAQGSLCCGDCSVEVRLFLDLQKV